MVDHDALSARLGAPDGYLVGLRGFEMYFRAELASRPELHQLAERSLHPACEAVLDTAHHVIADCGYRQPTSYKDAMEVLREAGHLDAPLAERLQDCMGFGNVLVHLCLAIDHGRVRDAILSDVDDLQQFARRLAPLLAETPRPPGEGP
jgi:uncharacterized protein YutE (UPF0331/DUF86 family)